MADAATAIPPLGRMNLIAIWIETLFYGLNCTVFLGCLYILTVRRQKIHWLLLLSSVFLFCLSTAHVAASLAQLLQSFTNTAVISIPHGTDIYFGVPWYGLAVAKTELYTVNVLAQDLLLIWRMYVVWGRNWKLCIVPFVVEMVHIVCAFLAIGLLTKPNSNIYSHAVQAWGMAGWSLDIVVNTTVTLAIAGRLWWAGRRVTVAGGHSSGYGYMASMFTVIESGALFATATLIVFILDASGNLAGSIGVSPLTQLATISPLLIIVRVGLGLTHGTHPTNGSTTAAGSASYLKFAPRSTTELAVKSASSGSDYPMSTIKQDGKSFGSVEGEPDV